MGSCVLFWINIQWELGDHFRDRERADLGGLKEERGGEDRFIHSEEEY